MICIYFWASCLLETEMMSWKCIVGQISCRNNLERKSRNLPRIFCQIIFLLFLIVNSCFAWWFCRDSNFLFDVLLRIFKKVDIKLAWTEIWICMIFSKILNTRTSAKAKLGEEVNKILLCCSWCISKDKCFALHIGYTTKLQNRKKNYPTNEFMNSYNCDKIWKKLVA